MKKTKNNSEASAANKESSRSKKITTPHQDKQLNCYEKGKYLTVETRFIKCVFDKSRGMVIYALWFKQKSNEPLLGTLLEGYYDDIAFAADFYSCHTIIEYPGEHKITDLNVCEPELSIEENNSSCVLVLAVKTNIRGVLFENKYLIDLKKACLEVNKKIILPERKFGIIHPLNITFMPTSFDQKTLFFATHNGGYKLEKFKIKDDLIIHSQSISPLISAKHGLGATEGIIVIGDNKKQLQFHHDPTTSALIPSIHYQPMQNKQYFLRLMYSAQEMDETFKGSKEIQEINCYWKIT